ncbi:MAG: Nif3-like dinuclear metal center hexameric protein [Actinomycetota bacterium]
MSVTRNEILTYLHEYLRVGDFRDYGPQGLQVEGRPMVGKVVSGVSGCVSLFEAAVEAGADLVIVHHGIFWDRESRVVKGGLKRRLEVLLDHDLTLAAYHLCLDAHPEVGNNALAARKLELANVRPWAEHNGRLLGFRGEWSGKTPQEALHAVNELYGTCGLAFLYGPEQVRQVGIVSGGAQSDVRTAIEDGLDLFITGEVSEYVMNAAREDGIHFISSGHHATERLGIRALGEHLASRFGIEHEFIDIANPV